MDSQNKSAELSVASPEIIAQIVRVRIADVRLGERLRPVDPVWAQALGQVMAVEGQKTPIEICRLPGKPGFLLVAGGHRLSGAALVGMETLDARVVSADAIERRQRELSENIWRKGLDPIDRAAFVAELIELRKVAAGIDPNKDGRVVSAQARWSETLKADADDASVTMTLAFGWADGVADNLGFSRKTIYRDLELHRGLRPDVAAQLRGHPLATNATQLRALAGLHEDEQRALAALIVDGAAKSVADAKAIRDQHVVITDRDPQDVFFSRQMALWGRLSAKSKALAFSEIFARDPNLPAHLKAMLAPLIQGGRVDG